MDLGESIEHYYIRIIKSQSYKKEAHRFLSLDFFGFHAVKTKMPVLAFSFSL